MAAALIRLLSKKTGHHIAIKCPSPLSSHFCTGLMLSGTNNFQRIPRHDKYHNDASTSSGRNTNVVTAAATTTTTKVETGPQLDALAESLASKGYLRPQKSYVPPDNVAHQVNDVLKASKVTTTKHLNIADKFTVLNGCFQHFGHGVPNSTLHEINNVADIVAFYEKEVNTTLPLDAMRTMELPANLHIQHEYVRFTEDTNSMFGGQTAFPRSSTIVTGLKYRKKYKGYKAKMSWP